MVNLIGNTPTAGGLKLHPALDENTYQPGIKVSDQELAELTIEREAFHGEWNYQINPNIA